LECSILTSLKKPSAKLAAVYFENNAILKPVCENKININLITDNQRPAADLGV
jgi:hypothetical protein